MLTNSSPSFPSSLPSLRRKQKEYRRGFASPGNLLNQKSPAEMIEIAGPPTGMTTAGTTIVIADAMIATKTTGGGAIAHDLAQWTAITGAIAVVVAVVVENAADTAIAVAAVTEVRIVIGNLVVKGHGTARPAAGVVAATDLAMIEGIDSEKSSNPIKPKISPSPFIESVSRLLSCTSFSLNHGQT